MNRLLQSRRMVALFVLVMIGAIAGFPPRTEAIVDDSPAPKASPAPDPNAVPKAEPKARGDAGLKVDAAVLPPMQLPQVRIDRLDLSAWPQVKLLATVLDGRGAPVELKKIPRLEVLDGATKTERNKKAPALVTFEKGIALDNRKDAKVVPRAEAGVGLDLVLVTQGYASTVEPLMQQRLRDAVAAAFKPLAKGDRVNLLWYGDRIKTVTGVKNLDTRLVDLEGDDYRKQCSEARRQARAGVPITLGPPAGKDTPEIQPGTDLCGLQPDAGKVAALAKSAQFEGAFPRLFNLGPPFWDLSRYCATPGGALEGFGPFTKAEYEPNKAKREEAQMMGKPTDFDTSAMDEALQLLLRDAKTDSHKAIVLLSDGRDGWVWDLAMCADHPPPPCNVYDASSPLNLDRLAKLPERQQLTERHQLAVGLRQCMAKNQLLTQRIVMMQKLFHDKAAQWIGLARAQGVHIYAVGIRRSGVPSSPLDLERLRLLAEKTGGTYREVDDQQAALPAVNKTMSEVTGQLAITFTHPTPDEVSREVPLSLKLGVRIDAKLTTADNPETQKYSLPVAALLPPQVPLWQQLKDVAWSLLVRIQLLVGYEVYVIAGWVLGVGASLLALLLLVLLVRKLVRPKVSQKA